MRETHSGAHPPSPDALPAPPCTVPGAGRADDIERLQRAAERASALQQIAEALARPIEYGEVVEAIVRISMQAGVHASTD